MVKRRHILLKLVPRTLGHLSLKPVASVVSESRILFLKLRRFEDFNSALKVRRAETNINVTVPDHYKINIAAAYFSSKDYRFIIKTNHLVMYSDIILQTFDAFQADQAQRTKAHNINKISTRQQTDLRHQLVHSSSFSRALSKRSLSTCRSHHRQGKGSRSGASGVEIAA